MRTTDLFTNNRSAKKLNETIEKTFGIKLNLESFTVEQLEDARNKLRTQIYTARSESSFNETVENDTLTQAQWMHDAIVAELVVRDEPIVDNTSQDDDDDDYDNPDNPKNWGGDHNDQAAWDDSRKKKEGVAEAADFDEQEVYKLFARFEETMNDMRIYGDYDHDEVMKLLRAGDIEGAVEVFSYHWGDQDGGEVEISDYLKDLEDNLDFVINGPDSEPDDNTDDGYALASAGHGSDEDYGGDFDQNESAPPTAKGERMVKHIKQGYAKDGKLTDKEKSIAYATAWKQHNKNESVNTGEDMTRLQEGEIQQASAIVTAKTMVDRVGRWIEELSGMENDTLLQLGDSIRDEMGQDLAKNFISTVAPAIQTALENLKSTRETLATGVRTLTGEEQPAEMLGAEPGMDMGADAGAEMGPAEPDAMNADAPIDDFAAAEPAIGGAEAAGREQRESINRSSNLLRVLAG